MITVVCTNGCLDDHGGDPLEVAYDYSGDLL
jgi:hypothetical protein